MRNTRIIYEDPDEYWYRTFQFPSVVFTNGFDRGYRLLNNNIHYFQITIQNIVLNWSVTSRTQQTNKIYKMCVHTMIFNRRFWAFVNRISGHQYVFPNKQLFLVRANAILDAFVILLFCEKRIGMKCIFVTNEMKTHIQKGFSLNQKEQKIILIKILRYLIIDYLIIEKLLKLDNNWCLVIFKIAISSSWRRKKRCANDVYFLFLL